MNETHTRTLSCKNASSYTLVQLIVYLPKIVSEYDQEIPQSQIAVKPVAL